MLVLIQFGAAGPVFDIAILENMYRQYDMHVPGPFGKLKIAEHYLVYYQKIQEKRLSLMHIMH